MPVTLRTRQVIPASEEYPKPEISKLRATKKLIDLFEQVITDTDTNPESAVDTDKSDDFEPVVLKDFKPPREKKEYIDKNGKES